LEQDIIRLAMRRTILDPLLQAFDKLFENFSSSGGGSSLLDSITGIFTKNADGNVYSGASISAYSGSVVSKPTFFARGGNVMGEAGPEAILPLKRGSDGKLGVSTDSSGSGMNVTVNLIESTGNGGQVNQKQEGNNLTLDIMVEKIEGMMGRNISQGRGIAPTMERQYGLNRAAGAY
jgi:lambda family phage tail tape measure protein